MNAAVIKTMRHAVEQDLRRKLVPMQKVILVALRMSEQPLTLAELTEAVGYQQISRVAVARNTLWLIDKGFVRTWKEKRRCGQRVCISRVYAIGGGK